jgi:thiol-disulfide isomerase/thioredoxin
VFSVNIGLRYYSENKSGDIESGSYIEAPYSFLFNKCITTEHDTIDFTKLKSRFVLLVVFSEQDCPSCLEEIRSINFLYNSLHNIGKINFIGFIIGKETDPYFLKKALNIKFPIVHFPKFPKQYLPDIKTPYKTIIDLSSQRIIFIDRLNQSPTEQARFVNIIKAMLS